LGNKVIKFAKDFNKGSDVLILVPITIVTKGALMSPNSVGISVLDCRITLDGVLELSFAGYEVCQVLLVEFSVTS